ncbi:hypothetical protein KGQ27_01990 [Patescibacteria group bacterium]|nr:hypothetical protein [Patescibacteria group bacterium]MDE1946311.1 SPFH domain-containing protein [Patescibacteria group bacterium]MDE2010763.1 SPFH domain-containing protein [Patescibacteria group bacterium]MDE2232648.1 SPFH domain-containing protein [Patescibacteria group bacterium]
MNDEDMCRSNARETMMWVAVGAQQLVAITLLSVGFGLLFQGLTTVWSLILATAFWTIIICFVRGINLFTANVADFHGAVLSNRFLSYKKPATDSDPMDLGKTRMLEEVGPGLHPKWPWQNAIFVDLRRQFTIDKPITAYSLDNIKLTVSYVMVLKALRGFLCNLVRNTEDESRQILVAGTESQLQAKLRGVNQENAIQHMNELDKWFGDIYGGDHKSHPTEKRCGLATSELTIRNITLSDEFQHAAELQAIAKKSGEAVKALVEAGKTEDKPITGKQALNALLAIDGKAEFKVFDVSGLENLQSVGGFIPENLFGSKKKEDKNKK